jgi:hypothetical protein
MNELKPEDVMPEGAVVEALEIRAPHDAVCRYALDLLREKDAEIERLSADKKGLINENEELKNQIQEPFFSEEDADLLDEYTRLLNEGIRDAKANNLSEIKTRFALRYGTYTDKDMTPIIEVFRLLDQIAKDMLEGNE